MYISTLNSRFCDEGCGISRDLNLSNVSANVPNHDHDFEETVGDFTVNGDLTVTGDTSHTGSVTFNSRLFAQNGSNTQPSYTFTGDTDTGIFRPGTNLVGISGGGVQSLTVGAGAITAANPFRAADGTVGAPSYSFTNANGAGIYHVGGGDICLTSQATDRLRISSTVDVKTPLTVSGGVLSLTDGLVANPSLTFSNDSDTGIARSTTDTVEFVSGGSSVFQIEPNNLNLLANLRVNTFDAGNVTTDYDWLSTDDYTFLKINFTVGGNFLQLPNSVGNGKTIMLAMGTDANNDTASLIVSGGNIVRYGTKTTSFFLTSNTFYTAVYHGVDWFLQ